MSRRDTLVFVPAWNEELNLPAVLDELAAGLPHADVLVVDDGSTDATADVARARGAAVLSFGHNRGLREGIAAGYGYARDHDYAYVGRADADGQHPVDELRRLLEGVREGSCDVAVGSRFAEGDGYEAFRYEPTAARKLGTAVLRRGMHAALGRPFRDPTSGMYAANAAAMPILAQPYESGAPEVESSCDSARRGCGSRRSRCTCASAQVESRSSADVERSSSCSPSRPPSCSTASCDGGGAG